MTHIVFQCDVCSVVAGVTLVHQWLVSKVEVAVGHTVCAAIDAHWGVEAILIVSIGTQCQVAVEFVHVGSLEVMSLGQTEVFVNQFAIIVTIEVSVELLYH